MTTIVEPFEGAYVTDDMDAYEGPQHVGKTYQAVMTRTSDGLTFTLDTESSPWHRSSMFWWTDGNGACDCNRHLWFHRHGLKDGDESDHDCGDNAYRIEKFIFEDGAELACDSPA